MLIFLSAGSFSTDCFKWWVVQTCDPSDLQLVVSDLDEVGFAQNFYKTGKTWGVWLAQSEKHVALNLRVVSELEPHIGYGDSLKIKSYKKPNNWMWLRLLVD